MNKIQLITPHKSQKVLINSLSEGGIKYVVAITGRQWGKSTIAQNIALKWAINNSKVTVMWVSPTEAQIRKVYNDIVKAIGDIPNLIKSKTNSSGNIQITFYNGTELLFKSAASEDSLRGYSVDYMIIDEAAFIKRNTVEEIILPMLTVRGKKCLFITTPKGKNYIYDYFLRGQSEKGWKSHRFSSYDSPLCSPEFIKLFKQNLPPKVFEQEIEAKFVDAANVFNNIEQILSLSSLEAPQEGKRYFAGVDIGLISDATVVTVIDDEGNLVKIYRYTNIQTDTLLNEIKTLDRLWKFDTIMIEKNNQGLPIIQQLENSLSNIESFQTTNKSKNEIINNLIHLFNTQQIKCVNDEQLRIELEAFIYKQNETGLIQYQAANGFNDDVVMALAIGIHNYNQYRYSGDVEFFIL
jgi:hypothetical protein